MQKAQSLMFNSIVNMPLKLLTIFPKASILMFEWVLDMPLTCLKKDKNCKFLRNFWENLYWEMIFLTVIFSKFCKKFRDSHPSCSIKKDLLKNFIIFTGKHLCWILFLIKLQDWRPTTLLKRDSSTGVFLWILQNS